MRTPDGGYYPEDAVVVPPADLFPYQREGAAFLAKHRYAYLGDEPGLGKTPQAIAACDLIHAKRIVVICPAIARAMWKREFERWGIEREGRTVFVESYDRASLRMDVRAHIEALAPEVLILDEAHFTQSLHTKRTKAIFGLDGKGGLAATADRVWCLSGTPAPNNVLALYPVLRALFPDKLPPVARSAMGFMSRYTHFLQTRYGVKVVGVRNAGELRGILSTVMLRRRVREVLADLPPLFWSSVVVERDGDDEGLDEALQAAGPELEALIAQEALGDNAQMSRVRRLVGAAKARPTAHLIADELHAEQYQKVIIFAHHHNVIDAIAEELARFGVVVVDGRTPEKNRNAAIDLFQNDPNVRVFVGQLQAANTAITLTAANQVVIVEPSWNPDDNEQAVRRALRIGQQLPVFARIVGLADSLDDGLARVIERKQRLRAQVLDPEMELSCSQ